MIRLDLDWMDNEEYLTSEFGGILRKPKDDAPQHVKDSYAHYLKQKEKALKREQEEGVILI